MLRTRSIPPQLIPIRGTVFMTPSYPQCRRLAVAIVQDYHSLTTKRYGNNPSTNVSSTSALQHRKFSAMYPLLGPHKSKPKSTDKNLYTFNQHASTVFVLYLLSNTYPYCEYVEFPFNKICLGPEQAEMSNVNHIGLILSSEPVQAFWTIAGHRFQVVSKEDASSTTDVLILRPEEWLEWPRHRKRGDPYKRF